MFDTVQGIALLAIWVITLGVKAWAAIDCLRRPSAAFPAVSRQSKALWLILTGLAALSGLFPGLSLNIIGLAGVVVALVYLFDVRPKIVDITSRRY